LHLVLFDVDGTLTRGSGAGARALEAAFSAIFGWENACAGMRFHGQTDRRLVRTVLSRRGALDPDPIRAGAQIDLVLGRYVALLPSEVSSRPYEALPGAAELLAALDQEGVAVGLVTGNHPFGAEQKLRSAGLWREFATGAFGSESEERSDLVRLALRRARASLGADLERTFVVGDAEEDVLAARGAQVVAVAVLTGGAGRDVLEARGADEIFSDLREAHRAGFWRR
jgi:phosphoglycolate phosphatase-like HAD superfamily hydrolase